MLALERERIKTNKQTQQTNTTNQNLLSELEIRKVNVMTLTWLVELDDNKRVLYY